MCVGRGERGWGEGRWGKGRRGRDRGLQRRDAGRQVGRESILWMQGKGALLFRGMNLDGRCRQQLDTYRKAGADMMHR